MERPGVENAPAEVIHDALRQHSTPVLRPLPAPYDEHASTQVYVLDPQLERLVQPQPRSIEQPGDQLHVPAQGLDDLRDLVGARPGAASSRVDEARRAWRDTLVQLSKQRY